MDAMRILLSTPVFLPHMGGLEVLVATLAEQLTDEGHSVRIMTSRLDAGITVGEHHGIPCSASTRSASCQNAILPGCSEPNEQWRTLRGSSSRR
jgi:hypothetical protein